MKRMSFTLFIVVLIIALSCERQPKQGIDLKITGENNDPVFTLNTSALDTSLQIANAPEKGIGSFYFKTSEGKQWIRGEPQKRSQDSAGYHAEWKVGERQVIIDITRTDKDFVVQLQANPNKDILGWGMNLSAKKDEYFTGLFERTVDGPQDKSWEEGMTEAMNLRGQQVDMIIKPTLSLYAPFYLSSRGYGMYVHGTWPGTYDLCKEVDDLVQIYFEGSSLKGTIYTRDEPKEIVKSYTLDAGPPVVPPKWAFTHWRWRDNHTNEDTYYDGTRVQAPYNSMLVEDILMMEALDIPCGAYWVDRPWAKGPYGYSDFEWDTDRLPRPKKMIDWLQRKNTKFLLWIAPWIKGSMAKEAKEKGYNLPLKKGVESDRVLIDFTNPEAKEWWQENGPGKMMRMGVKGFKLDRSEEIVPQSRDVKADDGRTARELRNDYPVEYVKATHEIAKKIHGNDFVLMPRAGYTGSSKYGVFWGGDIASPAEGLRAAIIALQRSSVIGYPLWGSDIGGYWGGDLDREVTCRWLAFGAFCPIMEVGPTEDKGLWALDEKPAYDPEVLATWRTYATLHTKLKDYTYKFAQRASKTGMPVARPLFLAYPDQPKAWKDWQTYMYGPDILVSAIWQKNKTSHECYLPEGATWVDAWNPQKEYKGGQTIEVSTPVYKIPVFVKKNAAENIQAEVGVRSLQELYKESLKIAKQEPDIKRLEQYANFGVE